MEENDLPNEQAPWNDRVFHLSLETLALVGDLEEVKTANYKLSKKGHPKVPSQEHVFEGSRRKGIYFEASRLHADRNVFQVEL